MTALRLEDLRQHSDVLRSRHGEAVTVRFVEPRDAEGVQNYFRGLSARSRCNRFFGAISQFKESIRIVANRPEVIILRMRHVPTIDASGIHILEELVEEAIANRRSVVFSAVSPKVFHVMEESGFAELVGKRNFAPDIFAALKIAKEHLSGTEGRPESVK